MLSLLAYIYGKVADLRNHLYDRGVFESRHLGARTISIGNITTGGTGKTPLVAYVAYILAARDEKICILTRGYGRANPKQRVLVSDGENILANVSEAGDEPFELAQKLIGKAIVIADADRVAAAEWAKRKFGVTAFVLDDGFQHRKANRDLDIVCIDAGAPFGGGKMLPAGRLREPVENLKRADVVIITRAHLSDEINNLKFEISNLAPNKPIFEAENRISKITELLGDGEFNKKTLIFAFCGIGNPENFFELLRQENLNNAGRRSFADHHFYTQIDIAAIEREAAEAGAEVLLTTAKDAVKLSNLKFEMPIYVVEIAMIIDDADAFAAMF